MLSVEPLRGFTLIELLITISILAVVLALGAPALGMYLQNAKIGASTSVIYGALQDARKEAIRQNVRAQFVLTDTPVSTANLGVAAAPAVAGRNWVVRAPDLNGNMVAVNSKDGGEGEASVAAPAVQLNAVAVGATPPFDGTITFNGFGVTVPPNASYTIDIANPSAGVCAPVGPIRCRRITISGGGQISACDPVAVAGDSRAC